VKVKVEVKSSKLKKPIHPVLIPDTKYLILKKWKVQSKKFKVERTYALSLDT